VLTAGEPPAVPVKSLNGEAEVTTKGLPKDYQNKNQLFIGPILSG